jgi:hypothetical protein
MPKTIITGTEHQETQNDRELKLLRMILADVVQIETKDWKSTEHRAFAIGRLEGMIEYKQLTK